MRLHKYVWQIYLSMKLDDAFPVADLWKAPKDSKAIGTATAGSSEAIMLGGLALKRRWQAARKAAEKDASKPNIVFGANAQVALEKFARCLVL
jgi:glutamate decarboxylase